jgi:hypothetical protein
MRNDMRSAQQLQEDKMDKLETNLTQKHYELSCKLDAKYNEYDKIIESTTSLAKTTADQIEDLKSIVQEQQTTINALKQAVA